MPTKKWLMGFLAFLVCLVGIAYLLGARITFEEKNSPITQAPRFEFVVGGTTSYWQSVILGARAAAKEHSAQLTVHVPQRDGKDQTRFLVMIKPDQVDGVAISPLFPDDQTRILSALASETNVVTYGNDVPNSLRQYYIGADNLSIGRLSADLVKEALPDGGNVALFIGDGHRDVARLRLHGFYNALLDTSKGVETLGDPVPKSGQNDKYTIVETYFDERNLEKARENAVRAIEDFPELQCMVSFYGYNAPACLKALESKGKSGEIPVVAFDAYDATLEGIESGKVFASVVQDAYKFGYESVRILESLHRGETLRAPAGAQRSTQVLPCSVLRRDDVSEYRKQMKKLLNQSEEVDLEQKTDKA